jgi:hypothetical protein
LPPPGKFVPLAPHSLRRRLGSSSAGRPLPTASFSSIALAVQGEAKVVVDVPAGTVAGQFILEFCCISFFCYLLPLFFIILTRIYLLFFQVLLIIYCLFNVFPNKILYDFFSRLDFNPALAGGIRGSSGIKGRLNPRGFQYASALFATILSEFLVS